MKKILKNKWLILLGFLFFLVLIFCHFKTFIINDDLPYSLYFRANNRITNILQIFNNQLFDYSHISPRIFIHIIVQFLLIFDKNLWSILNPLVIITIIFLMVYVIRLITKTKQNNTLYITIACIIGFLLLYDYKYLIYWVAGSVNYILIFLILLLLIIYYIKYGLVKRTILTTIICLMISILCEVSAIFVFGLIIFDLLINIFINKENKKIILKYIPLITFNVIGLLFILLAPSTIGRMGMENSIFKQLLIAIPHISTKLFSLTNIYNIFPILSILAIIYYLKKNNSKYLSKFIPLVIIFFIGSFISSWFNFLIGILIFFSYAFIFYKNKDYKLIVILLCFYLVAYSTAITNEYMAARPNIHLELFMIVFINYLILYKNDMPKLLKPLLYLLLFVTVGFEIYTYSYIGYIKNIREKSLNSVLKGDTKVLETKIIKYPFDKFHIDANSPVDKDYWAIEAFMDYYKLPENITIKKVE